MAAAHAKVKVNNSTKYDFDPFELVPTFRMLRNINSWFLAPPLIIFFGSIILLACAKSGTLGSVKNFQPSLDLERVFGIDHVTPAKPSFPLIRDVTSWYLALMVIATCIIVHRQWQLMACCLSSLVTNGVLRRKTRFTPDRLARVLRIDRHLQQGRPPTLDSFLLDVNKAGTARVARWAPVIALAAALLVLALIIGEKETLFHVLIPRRLNPFEQREWISTAYSSWWAGDNHPLGLIAYFVAALFGAYIIIIQNIIGVQALYVILALNSVADFGIDWLNRDGHYGWKPVARVFRTVYISLTLHGFTISLLLIVLGLQSFPWVSGLVAIWVIVVPLYLFVPWKTFKQIETRCKDERIKQLVRLVDEGSIDPDLHLRNLQLVVAEIERVRGVRIRPLRLLAPEFFTFVIAVILPIILTAAQIWFSVRFGPSKPG